MILSTYFWRAIGDREAADHPEVNITRAIRALMEAAGVAPFSGSLSTGLTQIKVITKKARRLGS